MRPWTWPLWCASIVAVQRQSSPRTVRMQVQPTTHPASSELRPHASSTARPRAQSVPWTRTDSHLLVRLHRWNTSGLRAAQRRSPRLAAAPAGIIATRSASLRRRKRGLTARTPGTRSAQRSRSDQRSAPAFHAKQKPSDTPPAWASARGCHQSGRSCYRPLRDRATGQIGAHGQRHGSGRAKRKAARVVWWTPSIPLASSP